MISWRSFLIGMTTVALVHAFTTCTEEPAGPDPVTDPGVDVQKIHDSAAEIEKAFAAADIERILELMTDESAEEFGAQLAEIQDRMPDFAGAMGSRELTSYSELYAEFTYTSEGATYTFALASQDNDVWKLLRF